jgi:hypothetical protein
MFIILTNPNPYIFILYYRVFEIRLIIIELNYIYKKKIIFKFINKVISYK